MGVALALGPLLSVVLVTAIAGGDEAKRITKPYVTRAQWLGHVTIGRLWIRESASDDIAVYDAVLESYFPGAESFPPVFAMTEWPADERPVPEPQEICFRDVQPTVGLVESFQRINSSIGRIPASATFSKPTHILSPVELERRRREDGAVKRVVLSKVGYSGDLALVYVTHYCPGLCGSGSYIVLKRDAQVWRAVDGCLTWIS